MIKHISHSLSLLTKPGDTIAETLEQLKMSQADLAERMGKTPSKINDLISSKEPITQATALQLEKVLGVDASFWLNSELKYRTLLARIEEDEKMTCWIPWAEAHPLKELKKCGYVATTTANVDAVKKLLLFYGVVSPKQWEIVCVPQNNSVQYRKSNLFETSLASLTSWLRMGELEMKQKVLPPFDKDRLKELLSEFRNIARGHPPDFATRLKNKCFEVGLALIYTRCLPKAPISGATRWIGGNPLVQLTDRYKTNDHFWFTLFHEFGHVLLHGKKDIYLEEADGFKIEEEKENEANQFACKWLLPDQSFVQLPKKIEIKDILEIANEYDVHPAIVVGRLQRANKIPYSFANHLKCSINLFPNN
jgi:HTH-type transcriptional regulator/antitoxin HigA